MFFFERDVSGRLVLATRKRLPDLTGTPALLSYLRDVRVLHLREIVLGMVRRGDFDMAVFYIKELLYSIAADYRFDFDSPKEGPINLVIDSLLIVLEALLASFDEQLTMLNILHLDTNDPGPHLTFGFYQWVSVHKLPPLDKTVAADLLRFITRILPTKYIEQTFLPIISLKYEAKLYNMLMSVAQFLYMSNTCLVEEAMFKALVEWTPPARVELLLLRSPTPESFARFLKLIREFLVQQDANGERVILRLTFMSVMRTVVSNPNCQWASDPKVTTAIISLIRTVEKLRTFRSIRVFKSFESLILTMLDLICRVANATTPNELLKATSLSQNVYFDRAVGLIKRENLSNRRFASRIAAASYLITIGFFSLTVSHRKEGEHFIHIIHEISPYISSIVDIYDDLEKASQTQLVVVCSRIFLDEFKRLLTKISAEKFFQVLQLHYVASQESHFAEILKSCSQEFSNFLQRILDSNDHAAIYEVLGLLYKISFRNMPVDNLRDMLTQLTKYATESKHITCDEREIFELFIAKLVEFAPDVLSLETLIPLIPMDSSLTILQRLDKLPGLYQFLILLAKGNLAVSPEHFETSGVLATRSIKVRESLLLCLCSEDVFSVSTSLKCLRFLQLDPQQSIAERDLITELLDIADQSLTSTAIIQKRMAISLASGFDQSFSYLNDAINDALDCEEYFKLPTKIQHNLLRMKVATLSYDSPRRRSVFYNKILEMNENEIEAVAHYVPLEASLAGEFLKVISHASSPLQNSLHDLSLSEHSTDLQIVPTSPEQCQVEVQFRGGAQLYTWLLHCLGSDHELTAAELELGLLCSQAILHLTPQSTVSQEIATLQMIQASAKYASLESNSQSSVLFPQVVSLIIGRRWNPKCNIQLESSLCKLCETYVEPNNAELLAMINKISSIGVDVSHVNILEPLFRANLKFALQTCDKVTGASDISRVSAYGALSNGLSAKLDKYEPGLESSDFVAYLLEHQPILHALCDVCSINDEDSLPAALLQMFRGYSANAERQLITIAVDYEISQSTSLADLFRGNSVTMKLIIRWLTNACSSYLTSVLSPALGYLRSASLAQELTLEPLFADAADRFKAKHFPLLGRWLLSLVEEKVNDKFGENFGSIAVDFILVIRLVCPVVVAPHQFEISKRSPSRQFAKILRQFAVYMQHHKEDIRESILSDYECNLTSCSKTERKCMCLDDYERLINENGSENSPEVANLQDGTIHTSSTRHVFHLFRKHVLEVRAVLLSRGFAQLVASMVGYLRVHHRSVQTENSDSTAQGDENSNIYSFKGFQTLTYNARRISDTATFKRSIESLCSRNLPGIIDFTDFAGLLDIWAECTVFLSCNTVNSPNSEPLLYVVNCPRKNKIAIMRAKALVTLPLRIEFLSSLDLINDADELPNSLSDAYNASQDIVGSVNYTVRAVIGRSFVEDEFDLYIGAKYMQFISDGACDVIPYIPITSKVHTLTVRATQYELFVSLGGSDFTIQNPPSSLIRVLELSLSAADAAHYGAYIDLSSFRPASVGYSKSPCSSLTSHQNNKHALLMQDTQYSASPGRLLFLTLCDLLHENPHIRRCSLELYSILPEVWGLQLVLPSPQQTLSPGLVFSMAKSASKKHPELAFYVLKGLASLGSKINKFSAQIAAPWVPYVTNHGVDRNLVQAKIIKPLLSSLIANPKTLGPILLEYFWPRLKYLPNMTASLICDAGANADADALVALKNISASGIPMDSPDDTRGFAEVLLSRLYSSLRADCDITATRWSCHPKWKKISAYSILFGSVAVDWQTAEALFPDVGVILLLLTGVGTPQLKTSLHQLFLNYLNAFLQSPNLTSTQRYKLSAVRSELTGPRGCVLFGVIRDSDATTQDWTSDDFTETTPEMMETLGRLLSETVVTVFARRLALYQETRITVATNVMGFLDVAWPPLTRRCLLGLMGCVRFLMPGTIVTDLMKTMARILAQMEPTGFRAQGILVSSFLRMFAETLECIPETHAHQQHFFWMALLALATGCEVLQGDAVRLLKSCVKIEHIRGTFKNIKVANFYLHGRPKWFDHLIPRLPLDVPSSVENFHLSIAQLIAPALQNPDSQTLALECCDFLALACPNEFVYSCYLYLGGEEHRLVARLPTGTFLDTDDAIPRWLGSQVRVVSPSSVLTLILCSQICGYQRSMNFSQTSQRLLELILLVQDRRAVRMVSLLLRPIFLKLLKLEDGEIEKRLALWSLFIFSTSIKEREELVKDATILVCTIKNFGLTPFVDSDYQLTPLFTEKEFTERTRQALGGDELVLQVDLGKSTSGDLEKLF